MNIAALSAPLLACDSPAEYTASMTTLTVQIPDEAAWIPDLRESISWFVAEQLKIARWRERHQDRAAEELVAEAEKLKGGEMDATTARSEFVRLWREVVA